MLLHLHHVAIICSDYTRSRQFYTEKLGLEVLAEHYRKEKESWKLDLGLNGNYLIELFSFPSPPPRPSYPEATGLRHLAFAVKDIDSCIRQLRIKGLEPEILRTDANTGKRFSFISDPDGLPIEFYEE